MTSIVPLRNTAAGNFFARLHHENPPFAYYLILICCFLVTSSNLQGEVLYAVNCGGDAYEAADGTQFEGDAYYSGGAMTSLSGDIEGTLDDELHHDYRWSSSSFSYSFTIANGDYVVDLYFADNSALGTRVFDVSIEGNLELDEFDIRAQAPERTEVIETFPVTIADGELNVAIASGTAGNGKLSAIRVRTPDPSGPTLPDLPFDNLVLVDEIDCGDPNDPHEFVDYPSGVSQIQTILGVPTRVLPNPNGADARYFAYRIGEGLGLEAGKAYVLQVDYPDDVSRTMYVTNAGGSMTRGFHTGQTVGDSLTPPYVFPNAESLDLPLSGEVKTWQNLFHLHDRFSGIDRPRGEGPYPDLPEDGFLVIVAQFANSDAPLSNGAAVSKIRLYEAPDEATYSLLLNLPPDGLPRRHTFYREEMADGVVWSYDPTQRGVADSLDWFEYKAKRMKFLGMNTYTTDLLEFGSNQGFDTGIGGGNAWYYVAREPDRWRRVLDMIGNYGFDVLPYFEYAGSRGSGSLALGPQKRSHPLNGTLTIYTHISWAEASRVDLADPDTIADAKLLLDATISQYKDKVNFVGAWFRARVSQMAMSFNDYDFATYSEEVNGGIPVTRQQIIDSEPLYLNYKQWWFEKRRDFINSMRDHLRDQGVNPEANILFTSDATETGKADVPPGQEDFVAEDATAWSSVGVAATSMQDALDVDRHFRGLTTPRDTWAGWEWQHADLENDPQNYTDNEGGMLTYSFNRYFTVAKPEALEAFRTPSGTAVVRHFCLNEDAMTIDKDGPNEVIPLGYFVSDCEYANSFSMMEEALAVANGDPRYLGYLCSWRYNPGFPAYVRAFNQAFLSLPALPSTMLSGATSDSNVVVRAIETEGYGTYLAVVNTARSDVTVTITLPERGLVEDAATGQIVDSNTGELTLEMYPYQLRAFRLDKQTLDGAVAQDDYVILDEGTTVDVNVRANDTGPGSLSLSSVGQARHGTVSIVSNQVRYVPDAGFYGEDSVAYTVTNGTDDDTARVYFTVSNTANANDLAGWNLANNKVGNYVVGHSRLLADGQTGELNGAGRGFEGNADSTFFERISLLGDFTITAHITDSTQVTDGAIGLMVRQGNNASSRFVALGLDASGNHVYFSRTAPGADSTAGSDASASGSWLRLVRTGSVIEMQVSTNNTSYNTIGRRVLPGLPVKLEAGLFLIGGSANTPVRGLVQDFAVSGQSLGSNVLLAQTFSDGANLSTYFNASPSQNQFSEIVAESEAGDWSITDGALQIVREGSSSSDSGAGFARLTDFAGPPSVVKFSFDFAVSGSSTNGTMATVTTGDFTSVSDYNSGGASASKFSQFSIKGNGVGLYHFPFGSAKYGDSLANGEMSTIVFYLNDTGSQQTYEGPDGTLYQIDDGKASYWLNGEVMYENFEPPGTYGASGIKTFRFHASSSDTATLRFDNFIIENSFPISSDPNTNTAPNAVNDTVSVDEGNSLFITPLANDVDPDNGPDGLVISNVDTPLHGTVTQSGSTLTYTPDPGYYGSDSFDYTVFDGTDTDTATVSVTVNDTSTAQNLNSLGLNGQTIGSATGGSRLLANGDLEITATGSGLGGSADSIQFEQLAVSGNFILDLRVTSLTAFGANPRGGIMIREDLGDDARVALLSTSTDGQYRYSARTSIGSTITEIDPSVGYTFPGAWVRMTRFEDTLTFLVSDDGINFTQIDTVTINGLPESVYAGVFSSNARVTATGFSVTPWQESIFEQDFSGSTTIADYYNALAPDRNQFTDIGAEDDAGTWSIYNGTLKLTRPNPGIDSDDNGAGFYRLVDFEGTPNLMKVSFDFAVENVSSFVNFASLDLGEWSSQADYNSSGATSVYSNSLSFKAGGTDLFRFQLSGQNSVTYAADGTPVTVEWYVNNTGQQVTYTGPDTQSHTIDHGRSSLWVNSSLVLDNIARSGAYSVNDIANMRLRCGTSLPIAMSFDNFVIEDSFLVNTPPVAAADTATTDERTAVTINVLANDTDSDSQPAALSIYSLGEARHGIISLFGSSVIYTPEPGFYGTDTFTYLVTDGAEQDWGLVTVTINSDTLYNTLESKELYGVDIGSGSDGSSRILQSGEWEITGSGTGLSSTSDSFHFEQTGVLGDFSIVAQVTELFGAGATQRAGIMIRESNSAGARMVALATTPSTYYTVIERTTTDASASETVTTESYSYPDAWLMLERVGDIINVAVSDDGQSFTQIDSVTLSSLAATVQAGLFASSGSQGTNTLASMDDFELTLSSAIFVQDFNSSTNFADYFNATSPSANQFNDISTEQYGGSWSIVSGALNLQRADPTTIADSTQAGAGFMRFTDFPGAPEVLKIEFDLSVNYISTYTDLAGMRIGDFTTQSDYSGSIPSVSTSFEMIIKGGGQDLFRFRINGTNSSTYAADGTAVHVIWYMNASGSSVNYVGPDNNTHTLDDLRNSLWIGSTLLFDNVQRSSVFGSTDLTDLYFRATTTQEAVFQFDNFTVSDSL